MKKERIRVIYSPVNETNVAKGLIPQLLTTDELKNLNGGLEDGSCGNYYCSKVKECANPSDAMYKCTGFGCSPYSD